MSDCANVAMRELLPDFLHGTLTPADRGAVESHLAACAECADELRLLRAVRESAVASTPVLDLASILAAIPAPPHPLPVAPPRPVLGGGRRVMPAWIGLAAALAIAALGSWATGLGRDSSQFGSDSSVVAMEQGSARLSFGGGVADLSHEDVIALLDEVETLDASPLADPDPAWGTLRGVGEP